MAVNLASPGVLVREVDLTIGNVDPTSGSIGALVAPFTKGPVEEPQLIENEEDLLQTFGQPYSIDNHYEYWMVASSYLSYGGTMQVIRADDFNTQTGVGLKNAFVGAASSIRIKSDTHYNQLGYDDNTITGVTVAAKTPGSYANGIRISIIDSAADQILRVPSGNTVQVGTAVTQTAVGRVAAGAGGTSVLDGYIKGIVTKSTDTTLEVKVLSHVSAAGTVTNQNYQQGGVYNFTPTGIVGLTTAGSQVVFNGPDVTYTQAVDWFERQDIVLTSTDANGNPLKIEWDAVADRPSTSTYAAARGGRFDELHVIVIDDKGAITGNAGTILEKHLNLSKAKDAEYSVGSTSYWRKYLATNSQYIYGGSEPAGVTTAGYSIPSNNTLDADSGWDQDASGVNFGVSGVVTASLAGGTNYGDKTDYTTVGALTSGVDDLISGYELFSNKEEIEVDFILMGAAHHPKEQSQALAEKCVAVAEARKDAVAFISPYRLSLIHI